MMPAVLLVDDDPDDADLVRLAFRKHGASADLLVQTDANEALAVLRATAMSPRQTDQLPVVVLLDLKLRGARGLDVLRRIRGTDATAALPVVVMTSSVEPRDVVDAYAAGANGYVRKPDSLEELVDVVGAVLDFWVFRNELPGRRALGEGR